MWRKEYYIISCIDRSKCLLPSFLLLPFSLDVPVEKKLHLLSLQLLMCQCTRFYLGLSPWITPSKEPWVAQHFLHCSYFTASSPLVGFVVSIRMTSPLLFCSCHEGFTTFLTLGASVDLKRRFSSFSSFDRTLSSNTFELAPLCSAYELPNFCLLLC